MVGDSVGLLGSELADVGVGAAVAEAEVDDRILFTASAIILSAAANWLPVCRTVVSGTCCIAGGCIVIDGENDVSGVFGVTMDFQYASATIGWLCQGHKHSVTNRSSIGSTGRHRSDEWDKKGRVQTFIRIRNEGVEPLLVNKFMALQLGDRAV
jgi:hypothetical protein